MTRRLMSVLLAAALVAALALTGCSTPAEKPAEEPAPAAATPAPIKIGTLPTEDSLPLWVAEDKGYFAEAGIPEVEIVVFQAAQERDAAFAAGAIDAYMGDIIAATNLEASGTKNTILTVMLGATQAEGRFGVVASPKSTVDYKSDANVSAAAGEPVGTSSATIQEYVLDGLMAEAGVPADQVKVEEVKKVPVRFELLMQGKLKFAALPEPFLSLAEEGGAATLGDDTKAKANLSQTVLGISDEYLRAEGGIDTAEELLKVWDRAVADVNADPESFRPMLVEKARLPESLATTYKVNTYPTAQVPTSEQVGAVLEWMKTKGYLSAEVTYEDLTLIKPE